ncbi:MAG TPA: XRE family transcriptional regulator [Lachnospiraceae bacterium]|nr:XRE family transcriptional regulator [Lachnospiraceae bacterium]
MTFAEKLKKAMHDLGLNQAQVVGMTGCSKGSVCQYLSGRNTPPEDKQRAMAVSLGLDPGYFIQTDPLAEMARRGCYIPELQVKDAAKLMRRACTTIEDGLKQGVYPWGYAVLLRSGKYRYFINARRFAEHEMVEVPPDMVV